MIQAFNIGFANVEALFTQKEEFQQLFNLAFHVGDDAKSVSARYAKLQQKFGFKRYFYAQQVHGTTIAIVDEATTMPLQADALITRTTETALFVHAADCTPICIYDENGTIAVVHAGRAGAQQKILTKTLHLMQERFGCKALHVALGPSIKACCYEIGQDVVKTVQHSYAFALEKRGADYFLDIEAMLLRELTHFSTIEIERHYACTRCEHNTFFSYRHNPNCGRQAAMMLRTRFIGL